MNECLALCLVQTLDRCGAIDILVSNAAVNPFFGNIMDSTEEVWDKVRTKIEPTPIIYDVRHKFAFFKMKDTVALICCHKKNNINPKCGSEELFTSL